MWGKKTAGAAYVNGKTLGEEPVGSPIDTIKISFAVRRALCSRNGRLNNPWVKEVGSFMTSD